MTTGAPHRGMRPEDIGALRHAHDPQVSPDGTMVAFSVTDVDLEANRYRSRVWLASADGELPPRPFSAGPDDQLPKWSPDGRWLALTSSPPEGPSEISVVPVTQGGERVVVARWPAPITELAWSPSSTDPRFRRSRARSRALRAQWRKAPGSGHAPQAPYPPVLPPRH